MLSLDRASHLIHIGITMTVTKNIDSLKVADLCWVALARLHRDQPRRKSFNKNEIAKMARELDQPDPRPGIAAHVYGHCIANSPRVSGNYRLFTKLPDGTLRLYRPTDTAHPSRSGKTKPTPDELPERYSDLLAWYETEYLKRPLDTVVEDDPILAGVGLGEHLWKDETGDDFVRAERQGW